MSFPKQLFLILLTPKAAIRDCQFCASCSPTQYVDLCAKVWPILGGVMANETKNNASIHPPPPLSQVGYDISVCLGRNNLVLSSHLASCEG